MFRCSGCLTRCLAFQASQKRTTGSVKVHLYKGNVYMKGRKSPYSLYDERLSSMVEAGGYDPINAEGFIKTNAIRLKANYHVAQKFSGVAHKK